MGALQHDTADMVSLLGGWPEGEEEATHDSITDCHMFANMHFQPSRDLPFLPVPWTTPHFLPAQLKHRDAIRH